MKSVKTFFIKRAKAALHIITIVGISIAICACTNDRCTIIGNVTGLNEEGWILMSDTWNHYKVIDSVRHENGQFRFDMDKIDFETFVCLQFKPDTQDREFDIRQFILEPGELIVEGDFRSDRWSGVTGSPMNEIMRRHREKTKVYYLNFSKIEAAEKADSLTKEIFEKNLTDACRLATIINQAMDYPSALLLDELDRLSDEYQVLESTKRHKIQLECRAKTEPQVEGSDMVPYYIDFTQKDLSGNQLSLKSVVENSANRYVLVDFWATWCGPCRDEVPNLIKAYDMFKDKGLEILGVSCDYDVNICRRYVESNGLNWIHVCEGKGHTIEPWTLYGLIGIPDNVLIDCKTGIIIRRDLRGEHMIDELSVLFK